MTLVSKETQERINNVGRSRKAAMRTRKAVLVYQGGIAKAGDIAELAWSEDLEAAPFSDKFHPVFTKA